MGRKARYTTVSTEVISTNIGPLLDKRVFSAEVDLSVGHLAQDKFGFDLYRLLQGRL